MLTHLEPHVQKHVECHRAKKHCKLQGVLSTRTPHREVGGRGGGPSLLRRGEKRLRQCHGQGAPNSRPGAQLCRPIVWLCWPMLAYVGLSCGQCGPILWLCWPMFGLMLTHVEPKDPKNGNSKKNTVKRRIF